MTQELFEIILSKFKDLNELRTEIDNLDDYSVDDDIELMKQGIFKKNPYLCISEYFKSQKLLIKYLYDINNSYCDKYYEDVEQKKEIIKYPEIYILFKDYINELNNENYLECKNIKDNLINNF